MLRTVLAVCTSMALTTAVVTNAWLQKKQFYPTVVHLTRSNQSMLILYVQAFVLVFLLAKLLGKVFFGNLRQAEAENLMERTWYAIIDTCLAFTMFRDDLSPGFVAAFTIFFLLKGKNFISNEIVCKKIGITTNKFYITNKVFIGSVKTVSISWSALRSLRGYSRSALCRC